MYVGHASELGSANDFRTGTLGGRPIIVTRDADGEFHVLLNRCLHRGATVCREERGRAKRFVCPYHGWAYATTASSPASPGPAATRAGPFDTAPCTRGGRRSPSTAASSSRRSTRTPDRSRTPRRGARPLLDVWIDRFPDGEVVARSGAHRMDCAANWKLVLDNSVDGYHPSFSHRSLLQMAQRLGESKDMGVLRREPG